MKNDKNSRVETSADHVHQTVVAELSSDLSTEHIVCVEKKTHRHVQSIDMDTDIDPTHTNTDLIAVAVSHAVLRDCSECVSVNDTNQNSVERSMSYLG